MKQAGNNQFMGSFIYILVHSHFDLVSSLLALEATEPVSEPVSEPVIQMALELIKQNISLNNLT